MRKSYVYRHIRLDKNDVFYVGMGTHIRNSKYQRAYCKQRKNKHWTNIANHRPYEVEIIMDDLTVDEAMEKEREFISLYGRRDLGKGTLTNLTDGGNYSLGKVISQKQREASSKRHGKKVCQYNKDGTFIKLHPSAEAAARLLNGTKSHICKCANMHDGHILAKGFMWKWYNGSTSDISPSPLNKNETKKSPIGMYDKKGVFLRSFNSLEDASVFTGVSKTQICSVVRGRKLTAKGLIFRKYNGNQENLIGTKRLLLSKAAIKVDKFSLRGELLETFDSGKEAAESISVTPMCISDCLKGRQKTAGGFIWKYH